MARVKSDAKKNGGASRAVIAAKMDAKHDPSVTGTVTVKIGKGGKGKGGAAAADGEAKPKRRNKPGMKALREITEQQRSVKTLIPKASIARLCREIVQDTTTFNDTLRMTPGSLAALQEAAEKFLVDKFEESNLFAIHAKRVTVMVPDLELTKLVNNRYTALQLPTKRDGMTTMDAYKAERKEANRAVNEARAKRKAAAEAAAAAAGAAGGDDEEEEEEEEEEAEAPVAAKRPAARKQPKKAAAAAEPEKAEEAAERPKAEKRPRKPSAKKAAAAAAADPAEEKAKADEPPAADVAELAM